LAVYGIIDGAASLGSRSPETFIVCSTRISMAF